MTRQTDSDANDLQRLERVLVAFGADRDRWPAEDRTVLGGLIERSAEARRLVREAGALDRALSGAPEAPAAAVAGAKERLFARLEEETAPESASRGNVVPFARRAVAPRLAVNPRSRWREAALLAASLVLGMFVGMQGLLQDSGITIPGVPTEIAESEDVSEMALGSDTSDEAEEELL